MLAKMVAMTVTPMNQKSNRSSFSSHVGATRIAESWLRSDRIDGLRAVMALLSTTAETGPPRREPIPAVRDQPRNSLQQI